MRIRRAAPGGEELFEFPLTEIDPTGEVSQWGAFRLILVSREERAARFSFAVPSPRIR